MIMGESVDDDKVRDQAAMAEVSVIFGGQDQGKYALEKDRMVVGRDPACEITIDNLGISRQHCAFEIRGDSFLIQDLGSSNGTYVNGKKVSQFFLNDGDEVVIGKYTLRFSNEGQTKEVPDRDMSVPDTMNTYVMDGTKIQDQLAKMREDKDADAPAQPGADATAKDFAKAMDVPEADKGLAAQFALIKNLLIVSVIANVVLVVVVVLILLGVISGPS